MTASVVEVLTGTVAAGGSANYNLSTTLVSSDVVVVLHSRGPTGTSSVTGLGGATFTNIYTLTVGNNRSVAEWTTGHSGAGLTVTVNMASGFPGGVVVYVVRGLNSASVVEQHSVWSSATTASGVDEFAPSQSFGTDQVAIGVAAISAGTATFPSNPTPTIGSWTSDFAVTSTARIYAAHCVGVSAGGTVTAAIRSSSITTMGAAVIVLGTETSAAELTSTFVGWGNPIF